MSEDARQIISEELNNSPGPKKMAGSSLLIQCPFHDENTPSCGVNLNQDSGIPLGWFHCFGCGAKGPWNRLAKQMGLTQFKKWQLDFKGNGATREEKRRTPEASMKSTNQLERMYKTLKTKELIEWPTRMDWRGYDGTLLRKLGALMFSEEVWNKQERAREAEVMLFFPIYVNEKFVGGVKAFMEKQKDGLSYLNTPGSWVRTSGLLGYDYIRKVIANVREKKKRQYTSLVLVEGPRDVARLLLNRVPAMAILGIENFSEKKLMKILAVNSNIKRLYVMSDNDKAGKRMYKIIKEMAANYIPVKRLKLPEEYDKKGKLIKMDPDDAPQELIDTVRELIESEMVKV